MSATAQTSREARNAAKLAHRARLLQDTPALTAERLRSLLNYEPETGAFRWRVARGRMRPGDHAGCVTRDGLQITIDWRSYRAGRLAVLYMTGEWPQLASGEPGEVDFIDHDNLNLRWLNLRAATTAQQHANQRLPRNSRTAINGVWRAATVKRWAGQVIAHGRVHKRLFDKIEDAKAFVREMRDRLHGVFACHG